MARNADKVTDVKITPSMERELIACALGQPSEDKLGSCMRMHLNMRGLLESVHPTRAGLVVAARAVEPKQTKAKER